MNADEPMVSVDLWAARIPGFGRFAEHHWFVIWRPSIADRWEVWQDADHGGDSWGHLHRNLLSPSQGVGKWSFVGRHPVNIDVRYPNSAENRVTGQFEKIATVYSEIEAGYLENELKIRHVPHVIDRSYDSAFGGLFTANRGWGHVSAPIECKDVVLNVLAAFRNRSS
jgi:hypothetical protein